MLKLDKWHSHKPPNATRKTWLPSRAKILFKLSSKHTYKIKFSYQKLLKNLSPTKFVLKKTKQFQCHSYEYNLKLPETVAHGLLVKIFQDSIACDHQRVQYEYAHQQAKVESKHHIRCIGLPHRLRYV